MRSGGVLHLTKHHGAGNDFLVVLDPDDARPLSAPEVRALCDRHRGIGADGVVRVVLDPVTPAGGSRALVMDLRNADGGVAEMSGNGIRCMVQAAVDAGLASPGAVEVRTLGGPRPVTYRAGPGVGEGYARVAMGPADLGPPMEVDVPGVRWARRVDMGNPHLVLAGGPASDDTVRTVGPRLERSLAAGANVEFVWSGPQSDELRMRVWERGVGETLACGTGACAAVAAAHAQGDVGAVVRVASAGGVLEVSIDDTGVWLAGPTQTVGAITVDDEVLAGLVAGAPGAPGGDGAGTASGIRPAGVAARP